MMSLWRWLISTPADLGKVRPWNMVIAERHAAATERLLLGGYRRARVIGNRRDEAIVDERERRVAEWRPAEQWQAARIWPLRIPSTPADFFAERREQ